LSKLQKLRIIAVKTGKLKLTISLRCAMSLATPSLPQASLALWRCARNAGLNT
jgi:hypothetical protein